MFNETPVKRSPSLVENPKGTKSTRRKANSVTNNIDEREEHGEAEQHERGRRAHDREEGNNVQDERDAPETDHTDVNTPTWKSLDTTSYITICEEMKRTTRIARRKRCARTSTPRHCSLR